MQRALVSYVAIVFLTAAQIAHGQVKSSPRKMTVAEAIAFVDAPTVDTMGNAGFGGLHTFMAIGGLRYEFEPVHAAAWKAALQNKKLSDGGRICATYFLLDKDQEARTFLQEKLASQNWRLRYNAAELLRFRIIHEKAQDWEIDLLIKLLKDGALDPRSIEEPTEDEVDEIVLTPIGTVCRTLGWQQVKRAVPAIISVLQRCGPDVEGAAIALGDLQDPRAIPILMKTLEQNTESVGGEVTALAAFKHKPAVPILVSRLGKLPTQIFNYDKDLLEALLKIGDPAAVPGIEKFMQQKKDIRTQATCKRVLVQLTNADPVPELLALLDQETYEFERWDLMQDLANYGGAKVRERFQTIATQSKSFDDRRGAILGLGKMGDQQSLLILASLLDHKLPKDIKGGWKVADHQQRFEEVIEETLQEKSRQNFGRDRTKWEAWINENVKS